MTKDEQIEILERLPKPAHEIKEELIKMFLNQPPTTKVCGFAGKG